MPRSDLVEVVIGERVGSSVADEEGGVNVSPDCGANVGDSISVGGTHCVGVGSKVAVGVTGDALVQALIIKHRLKKMRFKRFMVSSHLADVAVGVREAFEELVRDTGLQPISIMNTITHTAE